MGTRTGKKKPSHNLRQLAGKWVAFVNGKVFASAVTLPELMARVRQRKPTEKPSVMLVPRKDEGPYILIVS